MPAQLMVMLNGRVGAQGPIYQEDAPGIADMLAKFWPDLVRRGRVAVLVRKPDGVTHIVARGGTPDGLPANFGEGEA